ncbi:hypothetical protein BD414DRAFT_438344 [Trametes punicea]|nr:hypothetical protein BD414DRAFT_438344 [Trametes punicea]
MMPVLPDPLFDVLRAYATLQAPATIKLPELAFATVHDFLLHTVLANPHFEEYPPSKQYQVLFWKWVIDWLEHRASDEDEIDERIYTHHIGLLRDISSQRIGTSAPSTSYVTYLWPSENSASCSIYPGYANATLLESRTTVENGTTGLRTWSASLVLGQYLLSQPELVRGRTVLELGCGSGFLGVVAATIHLEDKDDPPSLWLTDVNESVLLRCEDNLRLRCNRSHRHPNLYLRSLDWFDAVDPEKRSSLQAFLDEVQPGILLGADVVYDPSIIPPLVNVLALALTPRRDGHMPEAYIALTQRNEETLSMFLREIERILSVETISTELVAHNVFTGSAELGLSASAQDVKVFRIHYRT